MMIQTNSEMQYPPVMNLVVASHSERMWAKNCSAHSSKQNAAKTKPFFELFV